MDRIKIGDKSVERLRNLDKDINEMTNKLQSLNFAKQIICQTWLDLNEAEGNWNLAENFELVKIVEKKENVE